MFDVDEFTSFTAGAEWLFPIGDFVEGGAGVSVTSRTVPTVYQCCVDNNGFEIEQELKLRRIPIDSDPARHAARPVVAGAGVLRRRASR